MNLDAGATAVIRLEDWMDLKPGDTLKLGPSSGQKTVTVIAVPTMHTVEIYADAATGSLENPAVELG